MNQPSIPVVPQVDLPRFMGDWYVIANIPSRFERDAHNAVENYRLTADGTIPTTFSYRKGGFEGKLKTVRSKAFVQDPVSNAVWGVQFIWPIKAEYLIAHLDDAYTQTVIARNKRDYVWIMARTPVIAEADYRRLVDVVRNLGYDTTKLQRVPQRW